MKNILSFAAIVAVAMLLASCEDSIQSGYGCGIYEYEEETVTQDLFGIFAIGKVEDYIKSKEAPWGNIIKTGSSEKNNDSQMQKELSTAIAGFSKEELDALLADSNLSFTYTCAKATANTQDEPQYLNGFTYNKH
jgi:hypothetical protein